MVLCEPIYIKSIPYYYQYYNNYVNKSNNCESDKFIINSLKCKHKFLIPKFITRDRLINKLKSINNNKTKNQEFTFLKEIETNINNNPKCSICFNTCHNRVFLGCYHSFCYKCLTEHINHQKSNNILKHSNSCNRINSNVNLNNKSICINVEKFETTKIINTIKCPICNDCVNKNDIYLLVPQYFLENNLTTKVNIEKYGTNSIYFKNIINLLYYYSIGDNEYKEFLFKYIGIKTFHILDLINRNKSPFNISKSKNNKKTFTYKIIISNSSNWVKSMNEILNNSSNLDYNTINFIDYKNFISLINSHFNVKYNLDSIKNTSTNKKKFIFYFTEFENILQSNNIKLLITEIKKNIKKNVYLKTISSIDFKQIIIKNTIDEKIFKNKIIIHK